MADNKSATVKGKPSGDAAAFTKCVNSGGKVTVKDNGDGTITETCTIGGASVDGPPKKKPTTDNTQKSDTKSGSKPNPFQKAKADVEQATAALKLNKFEVTTDGTAKGTVVKLNGKEIPNLQCLSFYHRPQSSYWPVELNYTVQDPEVKGGEFASYTQYSFKPVPPASAYASGNKAVANVAPDNSFVVTKHATDPLAHPLERGGRAAYANAFNK